MHASSLDILRCPHSHHPLALEDAVRDADGAIVSGRLVAPSGASYPIADGLPDFITPDRLDPLERDTQREYDGVADGIYDTAVDWQFASFCENEDRVREGILDQLSLQSGSRVLEIGCGTGRDSFRIARRLGPQGVFFLQDLSRKMVLHTRERLVRDGTSLRLSCSLEYFVSTGSDLPFADRYLDAVFHFGGFNTFGDKRKALEEMSRITRVGGKVVVCDESLPPWLEGTEFGEIVCTNNAMFRHKVPMDSLPSCARAVSIRWVLGGCFYVIEFQVGEGTPPLNLDLPHKGWRGGTMRTRYFGRLEGVSPELRQRAIDFVKKRGTSLHEWLNRIVGDALEREGGGVQ